MALILTHFFSQALTECSSMYVAVPLRTAASGSASDDPDGSPARPVRFPVLWLLPPLGQDHTAWLRHTDPEELAETYHLLVAMPDLKLSFGLSMVHGFDYFRLLTEELPALLGNMFPADLSMQWIAGAEEGAYAAVMAALRCPAQYRGCLALSGGSLTDETIPAGQTAVYANAFGTGNMAELQGTPYDLHYWLTKPESKPAAPAHTHASPDITVSFRQGDRLQVSAARLSDAVSRAGAGQAMILPGAGPCRFSDWEKALREFLPDSPL